MENKPTKKETGNTLSTVLAKMELISFEYCENIKVVYVEDIYNQAKLVSNFKTIIDYHPMPGKIIGSLFAGYLEQVRKMTGVKNWIDSEGVKMFMEFILDEHPDFNPLDLKLFCRKIIHGDYGQSYENISVQKLISWWKEYSQKRNNIVCELNHKKQQRKIWEEEQDIDRDGILKLAEGYGRMSKGTKKKERRYLSLGEYIERNDLDFDEFLSNQKKIYNKRLENLGYVIKEIDPILYEAQFEVHLKSYVYEKNLGLNKPPNK